jgi:hypothetical protein
MRFAPVNFHPIGGKLTWSKRELTGFNSLNDPQFGPLKTIVSVPYSGIEPWAANLTNFGEITTNGKLISFLGTTPKNNPAAAWYTYGYHLGSINIKDSTWDWTTAHATYEGYVGPFPTDGAFDIGNGVLNAARFHQAIDNFIFHQYNGEFYKGSQTNYWNIFYDNGLMIHQFGARRNMGIPQIPAQYGMAGNAFRGSITRIADGYNVYHNDESVHSGVGRWKISNISSLQLNEIPVSFLDVPIDTNTIDLMGDVPIDTAFANGTGGWVRSPAADDFTQISAKWWEIRTNVNSYDRFSKPDIFVKYRAPANITTRDTAILSKDMGDNNLANWAFKGLFNYAGGGGTLYTTSMADVNNNNTGSSVQILDDNGKIILKFGYFSNLTTGAISMVANGVVIKTWENFDAKTYREFWRDVSFDVSPSSAKFTFGDYSASIPIDPTANRNKPKTFRVYNWTKNRSADQIVSFKDLKLIKKWQ